MRLRIGIGMARMGILCHMLSSLSSYIIYGNALTSPLWPGVPQFSYGFSSCNPEVLSFWDNHISEFHVYRCRADQIRVRIDAPQDPRRATRETASNRLDWNSSLRFSFRGDYVRFRAHADKHVRECCAKTSCCGHPLCQVRAGEDARKPRGEVCLCGCWLPGCKSAWIKECANHDRSLRRFSMPRVQEFL